MQGLGTTGSLAPIYWCPRCGTVRIGSDPLSLRDEYTPALVERCRKFEEEQVTDFKIPPEVLEAWQCVGIAEAINRPTNRPEGG